MRSQRGFTLIELLVVILIIGILAAIAIPAFIRQREKGADGAAKAVARAAQTAMEAYAVERPTGYTGASVNELRLVDATLPLGPTLVVSGVSSRGYTVGVKSTTPATFSIVRATNGRVSRRCDPVTQRGKGGCGANGTW